MFNLGSVLRPRFYPTPSGHVPASSFSPCHFTVAVAAISRGRREKWNDSGSIFDTDVVELQRFHRDWSSCVGDLGILKLIMKMDNDAHLDLDGDGTPDEVQEVQAVLWQFHDTVNLLFMWYAAEAGAGQATVISYDSWIR